LLKLSNNYTGLHEQLNAARGKARGGSHPKTGFFLSDDEGILIREGNYKTESFQLEATISKPSSATSVIRH